MKYELVKFDGDHAREIFKANDAKLPLSPDEMIRVYCSPGSVALTLMVDGIPIASAGIINLSWNRGEAWLLTSPEFERHHKTTYRYMQSTIPVLVDMGGFERVQATSFGGRHEAMFKHLGFQFEGVMRHFGPAGEDAFMYSRIFQRRAQCLQ